jgi:arginyl-tRNA synthetase
MTNVINNNEDVMDSRDIEERIQELVNELEEKDSDLRTATSRFNEWSDEDPDHKQDLYDDMDVARVELEEFTEDCGRELEILQELKNDALSVTSEWDDGATLIRESYFTEYAEELCRDIGDTPRNLPWYIDNNIDWEGVADDLKNDYATVDFDGISYYIRRL